MKAYWDSSALVSTAADEDLRNPLKQDRGFTRTHALSEVFSALTAGNLEVRVDIDEAAAFVGSLAEDLDFVDLTAAEVVIAIKSARAKGVRGGRIHDFLHIKAAEKCANELFTTDRNDFVNLSPSLAIIQL